MIGEFRQITAHELLVWSKVLSEDQECNGVSDVLNELELIDDLLVLQKTKSILNRKRNLKTQLEARIGKELGHDRINLNIK